MLALSMGKPVVAPRCGALVDLPDDVGYFYDADDEAGLGKALDEALSATDRDQRGKAGRAYAERLAWPEIAARTLAVYESVSRRTAR